MTWQERSAPAGDGLPTSTSSPSLNWRNAPALLTSRHSAALGLRQPELGEKNSTLGLRGGNVVPWWSLGGAAVATVGASWSSTLEADFWEQPLCHSSLPNTKKPHRPHLPCRAGSRQSATAEAGNKNQLGVLSPRQGRQTSVLQLPNFLPQPKPGEHSSAEALDLGQLGLGKDSDVSCV